MQLPYKRLCLSSDIRGSVIKNRFTNKKFIKTIGI